ncbi:MAG TPA: hypothetical protein VFD49_08745 [Candidatus Dormibacteraeota bacterium]|nr:hypothetical protein [Candidatus Dormibacteraeota bacterium]
MSVLGPLQCCAVCGVRTRRTVIRRRQRFACCPACDEGSIGPRAGAMPDLRRHGPLPGARRPVAEGRPRAGLVRDLLRCLAPSPSRASGRWRP